MKPTLLLLLSLGLIFHSHAQPKCENGCRDIGFGCVCENSVSETQAIDINKKIADLQKNYFVDVAFSSLNWDAYQNPTTNLKTNAYVNGLSEDNLQRKANHIIFLYNSSNGKAWVYYGNTNFRFFKPYISKIKKNFTQTYRKKGSFAAIDSTVNLFYKIYTSLTLSQIATIKRYAVELDNKEAIANYNWGYDRYTIKNYRDAVSFFQKALKYGYKDNSDIYLYLGTSLFYLNKDSEALDVFDKITQHINSEDYYFNKSEAYSRLKRYGDALMTCNKGLEFILKVQICITNYFRFIVNRVILVRKKTSSKPTN